MHFGDLAAFNKDKVRIRVSARIFDIVEVKDGRTVNDAAADGGDAAADRVFLNRARSKQAIDRKPQGDPRARDSRSARSAVGLQHVTIDRDLMLAQLFHIYDSA